MGAYCLACFDLNSVKDIADLILTLILTIATVYLAIYTYGLFKETRTIRKAQAQPYVSIYLDNAEVDPTLLYIVVRNIGPGTAYNLSFKIVKDINSDGGDTTKIGIRGLFKEGMRFCPPDFIKKFFIAETTKNYDAKMDEELIIKAQYYNIFKELIEETFHLKLKEHAMVSKITPADTYIGRISETLDEIKKDLSMKKS